MRTAASAAVAVAVFFVLKKTIFVRLYPVAVSAVFLAVFGFTLLPFCKVPIVFRFACLQDKSIARSANKEQVRRYCWKVTAAWCVFFAANGSVALWTALRGSDAVWSVYNGIVSYILMGAMFAIELIIRRRVNSKMTQCLDKPPMAATGQPCLDKPPQSVVPESPRAGKGERGSCKASYRGAVPECRGAAYRGASITKFNASSWELSRVMCYDGTYSGNKKTWKDFLIETAKLRKAIGSDASPQDWVLHCDDYWYFTCAFVALLQCKKRVLLTQNTTEQFLSEVRKAGDGFITDIKDMKDALYVPSFLAEAAEPSEAQMMATPAIDADTTQILMFTSGSTGHAKAVHQRMTEFEADNAFIISKWGDDFTSRALISTVSAHHIYGFLFGVSLPFTLGVPFRRKRVEYPEELEALTDRSYMIIAVPAFLKRTVEALEHLVLRSPFIFTSGGAVPFDVAEKTSKVIGAWPLEVYGSTETSGIAWRLSKDGMEWTPFDNAKVWKGDDGCLVIISPYIKDPAGFATSDLVEMTGDGRFKLLGRADSIVKIEEKRVSLTEVEARLLQTGLAAEAKAIAMEDKRQYLAAAVVLNKAGKNKFAGKRRLEINRYFHDQLMRSMENVVIPKRWRYVDELPKDLQGKVHKEDIQAMFAHDESHGIKDEVVTVAQCRPVGTAHQNTSESEGGNGEKVVQLEFIIPKESDFFDGHFPEFHLLPAVAQFEIVTRFAKKYFGTQRYVPYIRRIKFSAPILPDTKVALKMEYSKGKGSIAYSLWDAQKGDMYSSGTFSAGEKE